MNNRYAKPTIVINEELFEGVYANSGSSNAKCDSIHMKGKPQSPTYNPIKDGYKIGRGCEGCSAWDGSSCRLVSKPEELNWDGDFRPTWEVQGHLPDELGY